MKRVQTDRRMNMKKKWIALLLVTVLGAFTFTGCANDKSTASREDKTGDEEEDLAALRDLSWEGTELTIMLGENKGTGCEWETEPQDDRIIDYSVNRSFKLSDKGMLKGESYGTLSAGFEGVGEGTAEIICWTPVDWDGEGDGYTWIVTVTVNADGTIESAKGRDGEASDRANYNAARYAAEEAETGSDETDGAGEEPYLGQSDYVPRDDGVRYYGVGVMADDICITDEDVQTWWLELYDDGTGFLYNGEDSHGTVSSWEEEGDAFKMTAGIADIEGTDQQGILTLDFDSYYIVYALEDADLSALTMMTLEEYKKQYGE